MRNIILLICAVFSVPALAGGWQTETSIESYVIEGGPAGERFYVKFKKNFNPDNCTGIGLMWNRVDGTTEQVSF